MCAYLLCVCERKRNRERERTSYRSGKNESSYASTEAKTGGTFAPPEKRLDFARSHDSTLFRVWDSGFEVWVVGFRV